MIMKYDLPVPSLKKSQSETQSIKEKLEWKFANDIEYEGYLYVQNRSFWRLPKHAWKKKYFILRSGSLYITESKTDNIDDSTCIKIGLDTGIYPRDNVAGKPKYYIRITTGKQNYTLRSTEETDRNTWLTSLLTSIFSTLIGTTADDVDETNETE